MTLYDAEKYILPHELKRLYVLDDATGAILRRRDGRRADKVYFGRAPFYARARYRQVIVPLGQARLRLYAHRMAWALARGRWPAAGMDIDHLNANVHDNRPCNLAEVTEAENRRRAPLRRFVWLLHAAP